MKLPSSLAAALLLALTSPASAATVVIGSGTGTRGGTVDIPITFVTGGAQIAAMSMDLVFPTDALTLDSITAGPAASNHTVNGGATATGGTLISVTRDASGPSGLGDGLIATLRLSILPAAPATVSITATVPVAIDITGMAVTTTASPGVVTIGGCTAPAAPAFTQTTATLRAGQSYSATWSAPSGLGIGGYYRLEVSSSPSFATILESQTTDKTSAVIGTSVAPSDTTLHARVQGVLGVGCDIAGPFSQTPLVLTVRGVGATFALTGTAPFPITAFGSSASASATYRNVGAQAGRLTLSGSEVFDVSPAALDLAPGQSSTVTLNARSTALSRTGPHTGNLVATSGSQTISTPFTLTVATGAVATGSRAGTRLRASASTITFAAPAGQNPASQQLTLTLEAISGPGPVFLAPSVGPGGAWLRLGNELDLALENVGRVVTLTLSVDRGRQSASDGVAPFRTLLQIAPVGGAPEDAIIVEVLDTVPPAISSGAGRGGRPEPLAAPPAGTSFIVPTTAKARGQFDAEFFSDGWLRNVGSQDVAAELFYTPQDADGLTGNAIKAAITVPASSTVRLSDLLGAVFQTSGTGQVEVRSPSPFSLTLRSTVESVTRGDPTLRFGTEIPTVAYGAGVGLGQADLTVAGISDDEANRSNLILAETTGAAARALVSVYDENGQPVGSFEADVPPYGKVQFTNVVKRVLPEDDLTGGLLGVKVIGGAGRVVAIVTVIDNRSNSFSAVRGVLPRAGGSLPEARRQALATGPLTAILPAAVRTLGANDTLFTTNLFLANGTGLPANLTLTYNYVDQDDGNQRKTVSKSFVLPPRGALPAGLGSDVLAVLLGLSNRTFGWMKLEGDVARVVGYTAVSAAVDPNDPSKGVKTSAVPGFLSDARELMDSTEGEHRFTGAEKSVGKRSNMVLVETSGAGAEVRVRVYAPGGERLAERTYSLSGNEYRQINDLFGPDGLDLGSGPFQNMEVTAEVLDGAGRVLADVSVIDNLSRNPAIYVLSEPGPPSLGF